MAQVVSSNRSDSDAKFNFSDAKLNVTVVTLKNRHSETENNKLCCLQKRYSSLKDENNIFET